MDVGPIDREPPLGADPDRAPAGIAQVEVVSRVVAKTVASDANEDGRRAAIEPSPGLEHADDAMNREKGRRLATIGKVAFGQPIAAPRRPDSIGLVPVADLDPGMETAVRRARKPRGRGEAQEDLDRAFHALIRLDDLAI
ncbi:MAG: hypothetical protein ACHQ50_17270 [Fimbriimonadales bacterium]